MIPARWRLHRFLHVSRRRCLVLGPPRRRDLNRPVLFEAIVEPFASSTAVPDSTIRPAIFSASLLTDPALWGAHHDLTGPVAMSWPEALELLSAELGEHVTFRVAAERQFLERLIGAGVPAGMAELLIAREWAILAGENDYTTDTFQQITSRPAPGGRVPSRAPRGIRLMVVLDATAVNRARRACTQRKSGRRRRRS
jgi:hypothetical protein